ncbi:N-acetyltransferase DgcN [Emcibacter nanhaiensis]|uniref:DUF1611 domain-containing protein n=1 Tax=Emcibacter nanhaiensis TaxID=1505037 RepID=A0A501PHL1_9PROT|nr:DUF1611 domain-containing protein [Emcibacter nanhaiensis]
MHIKSPYLLFLGADPDPLNIKTSRGIAHWRPENCLGQLSMPGGQTLELEELSTREAANRGAKTFVLGLANNGGIISEDWIPYILEALDAGLDVANGLHQRLSDIPIVRDTADKCGRLLHDVRHSDTDFETGTGRKRSGKRLLTVGTDCAVGKMYTALSIEREMRNRNYRVDFRATGQTGILIAGSGVAIDAVVADFIAGAVEKLSPDNDPDHWDVIEGQGSLFNPAFSGVSLGLLHGAQPDVLIMCHQPGRETVKDLDHCPLPGIGECIDSNLRAARLTNPGVRLGGISLNSRLIPEQDYRRLCMELGEKFDVPCFDPLIDGVGECVDRL